MCYGLYLSAIKDSVLLGFGRHLSGAVLHTVTSQREEPRGFGVKFACSLCNCVGFLWVHQLPDAAARSSSAVQSDHLRINCILTKQRNAAVILTRNKFYFFKFRLRFSPESQRSDLLKSGSSCQTDRWWSKLETWHSGVRGSVEPAPSY